MLEQPCKQLVCGRLVRACCGRQPKPEVRTAEHCRCRNGWVATKLPVLVLGEQKLDVGQAVLQPISGALHYLEGDKVPLSHVFPIYAGLYAYVESLADEMSVSALLRC